MKGECATIAGESMIPFPFQGKSFAKVMYKQAAHYTVSHHLPFQISGLHEKTKKGKARQQQQQKQNNPLKKTTTIIRTTTKPRPFYYGGHEVQSLQSSTLFKQQKKVIPTDPLKKFPL